jgi:hypothetical protein
VHGFKVRFIGCGCVSEDFGKEWREKGVSREFDERLDTLVGRGPISLDWQAVLADDEEE